MFQSLNRVTYQVADVEKAKNWYRDILNREPVFDSPMIAVFAIGESILSLVLNPNLSLENNQRVVAFWNVDDIDEAYQKLLNAGAASHSEISNVLNTRIAKVIDPFGNIIGISSKVLGKSKTLEEQPSETAMTVAFCRAMAANEERVERKGPDYLAEIFLTEDGKRPLKEPVARKWVMENLMNDGVYEYMIARTKYFDEIVEEALHKEIPQIVFLGAGYDTRPYRFRHLIQNTQIFELDSKATQQRKQILLNQAQIGISEQIKYVTLNFEKDSLVDELLKHGFQTTKQTLFIWEGVTYYLSKQAVDETLNFIRGNSPLGSNLCFDYMAEAPDMMERYNVKKVLDSMKTTYVSENIRFRIHEGDLDTFCLKRRFEVVEHLSASEIEKKYLTFQDETLAAKIPALFCIARISVK